MATGQEVQVQVMQWGAIPYMGSQDLQPFTPADAQCFKDIRDVLVRHGALKRFGMFLIHKHFEVADDEELTECTDHEGRRLTVFVQKKSDRDDAATVPTNWIFTETAEVASVCCVCASNPSGHLGYHRQRISRA